LGALGAMTSSVAPVSESVASTFFHVRPPSVVLKMPRSPPGPNSDPLDATSTVLSFVGSITMRATCCDRARPIFCHVLPPSVLLYTPSPNDVVWRLFTSPVPAHTRSGFDGETATQPIDI